MATSNDGLVGMEPTARIGGSAAISVIGLSLAEAQEERRLRLEAEQRAELAGQWRDHYERRWRGAERRVSRAMRVNRALWNGLRLWQAWARAGWGAAIVAGFVAVLLALTLFKTLGG